MAPEDWKAAISEWGAGGGRGCGDFGVASVYYPVMLSAFGLARCCFQFAIAVALLVLA